MGLIFTPTLVRLILGPLYVCLGLWLALLDSYIDTLNSPIERCNQPTAAHQPYPLVYTVCNITVVVKKLPKIQQC